ncbi:hypothetical protein OVA24_19465 [Luteolibacter sp. SL250]|uniref:hypothetical protein n=1 Tax=Luteolibacter sp. SL250 TaxID=2995170 RepID=UPI00226E1319|nr:hypothetical protein [Luteolibacter sp. SL250]WAC19410.1 hypothetical protein OVA24_19465 [Luteolibacter sp. SL250]
MRFLLPLLLLQAATAAETLEELWKLPLLYKNTSHDGFREFTLAGNFQWNWAEGDSDRGSFGSRDRTDESTWDGIEVRRMDVGFRAQYSDEWRLQVKFNINPDGRLDPSYDDSFSHGFYRDIQQFSLVYTYSPAFHMGIGKITPKFFSAEYYQSSTDLIVFERSLLVDALVPREITGIWASGSRDNRLYALAVYAGDHQAEFTEFDAGVIVQFSFAYDFGRYLDVDRAIVKFDHQFSDSTKNSAGAGRFKHADSINILIQKDRWSLYTDLLAGMGHEGQGDVIGFTLTPSYRLTEKLELVFRYQHANGEDDALQLLSRYERLAPDLTDGGRGSSFDAAYLGLNYYVHGHKLKVMAGTEYQSMDGGGDGGDYEGFTTLVGLRLSF